MVRSRAPRLLGESTAFANRAPLVDLQMVMCVCRRGVRKRVGRMVLKELANITAELAQIEVGEVDDTGQLMDADEDF